MRIPWYTRKQIEHEFFNYEYYQQELIEAKNLILYGSPSPPDGQPNGNQTSNPTEQKAIKIIESTSVIALEKTIRAIEWSLQSLTDEHRQVFREIYTRCRQDYGAVAIELHISPETLKRKRRELIEMFGLRWGIIKS